MIYVLTPVRLPQGITSGLSHTSPFGRLSLLGVPNPFKRKLSADTVLLVLLASLCLFPFVGLHPTTVHSETTHLLPHQRSFSYVSPLSHKRRGTLATCSPTLPHPQARSNSSRMLHALTTAKLEETSTPAELKYMSPPASSLGGAMDPLTD